MIIQALTLIAGFLGMWLITRFTAASVKARARKEGGRSRPSRL